MITFFTRCNHENEPTNFNNEIKRRRAFYNPAFVKFLKTRLNVTNEIMHQTYFSGRLEQLKQKKTNRTITVESR